MYLGMVAHALLEVQEATLLMNHGCLPGLAMKRHEFPALLGLGRIVG
jgi:hypothetical protein